MVQLKDGSTKIVDKLTSSDVSLSDIPYYSVKNTDGKASYSIDINSSSPGSLIGPSILKTEVDPTSLFLNKNLWLPAPSTSNKMKSNQTDLFQEKIFDASIGIAIKGDSKSIVDLLTNNFNDVYTKKWKTKYASLNNDFHNFKNTLNQYFTSIKDHASIGLFDALKIIESRISKGKNFGVLRSISILRSWLIDSSIYAKVSNDVIQEINASFDNLMRFINFKLHDTMDPILSDKARNFDISKIFNFKYSNTYGEMPKTYVQRFISGKDIVGGKYPEATEILLNSGIVLGILEETSKQREYKHYDLPVDFQAVLNKKTTYFKSPLLSATQKVWNSFIKNDHLAVSTYRLNSIEYRQNINRLSKYLSKQHNIYDSYKKSSFDNFNDFVKSLQNQSKTQNYDAFISSGDHDLTMMIFNGFWAVADLASFVGKSAGPIGALISIGLDVAMNLVNAIVGEVKYDPFYYTHKDSRQQKYYWNGASHREHKFFGISFGNSDVTGKESMELVEPIKVRSESSVDKFYYDKKLYDSKEEMKLQFLKDLKNGKSTSMKQKQEINLVSKNGSSKTYDAATNDNLTNLILKDWKMNKYQPIQGHVSKGGISIGIGSKKEKEEAINQILVDYKPVRIIELPDKGKKNGKDELWEPIYPGLYVMPVTRKNYLYGAPLPLNDTLKHTYWIFDTNLIEGKTKNTAFIPTEEKIIKEFKKVFSIKSKIVLKQDIIIYNDNKYNEMDEVNSTISTVFESKSFDGEIETFLNIGQAYSWLLSKMLFTFVEKTISKKYVYNGHTFLSSSELMTWVLNHQGGTYV